MEKQSGDFLMTVGRLITLFAVGPTRSKGLGSSTGDRRFSCCLTSVVNLASLMSCHRPHLVSPMLSNPVGFLQQGAAGLVRTIESVSMTAAALGFVTVLKVPKEFGSVSESAKTFAEF